MRMNDCGWQSQEQAILNEILNKFIAYVRIGDLDFLDGIDGGEFRGWMESLPKESEERFRNMYYECKDRLKDQPYGGE